MPSRRRGNNERREGEEERTFLAMWLVAATKTNRDREGENKGTRNVTVRAGSALMQKKTVYLLDIAPALRVNQFFTRLTLCTRRIFRISWAWPRRGRRHFSQCFRHGKVLHLQLKVEVCGAGLERGNHLNQGQRRLLLPFSASYECGTGSSMTLWESALSPGKMD